MLRSLRVLWFNLRAPESAKLIVRAIDLGERAEALGYLRAATAFRRAAGAVSTEDHARYLQRRDTDKASSDE